MAYPSVTYSFTNSTTADATQVNQNFQDLINGFSDGTKDLNMNAATFAGNLTVNGNTTLGNASSDTLTVTASLASSIPIGTTNSYDIGSSTLGLRALYFGANSQTVKIQGSASMSATWTLTLPTSAGTAKGVPYLSSAGVMEWATTLGWDESSIRLGIGTLSPSYILHVSRSASADTVGYTQNTNNTNIDIGWGAIGYNSNGYDLVYRNDDVSTRLICYGTTNNFALTVNSIDAFNVGVDGRMFGSSSIHRALSSTQDSTSGTTTYIESGTYTPTTSALTNLDSATNASIIWIRIGRVVHCTGEVTVDATSANTQSSFSITLPISSTVNRADLNGVASVDQGATAPGCIAAIVYGNSNLAKFDWISGTSTAGHYIRFSFNYTVN